MGFMEGKKALVVGVASDRSICWGVAKAMKREGAEVRLTYQNDRLKGRVEKLSEELGCAEPMPLDLMDPEQLTAAAAALEEQWGGLDVAVHGAAFAPKESLTGDYLDGISLEAFRTAHEVSSYSFTAMAQAFRPLMQERNGALLTLTYIGAEKAMRNYNVMGVAKASLEASVRYLAQSLGPEGIRVNAVSAGPIRTLAASGISGFREILDHYAQRSALQRNVTIDEVGNMGAFLCSDLASGITAEISYVDAGYNAMGL